MINIAENKTHINNNFSKIAQIIDDDLKKHCKNFSIHKSQVCRILKKKNWKNPE